MPQEERIKCSAGHLNQSPLFFPLCRVRGAVWAVIKSAQRQCESLRGALISLKKKGAGGFSHRRGCSILLCEFSILLVRVSVACELADFCKRVVPAGGWPRVVLFNVYGGLTQRVKVEDGVTWACVTCRLTVFKICQILTNNELNKISNKCSNTTFRQKHHRWNRTLVTFDT